MSFFKNFIAEENGQDMVEYGLVVGLIVLAAVGALTAYSGVISTAFGVQGGRITTNVK